MAASEVCHESSAHAVDSLGACQSVCYQLPNITSNRAAFRSLVSSRVHASTHPPRPARQPARVARRIRVLARAPATPRTANARAVCSGPCRADSPRFGETGLARAAGPTLGQRQADTVVIRRHDRWPLATRPGRRDGSPDPAPHSVTKEPHIRCFENDLWWLRAPVRGVWAACSVELAHTLGKFAQNVS